MVNDLTPVKWLVAHPWTMAWVGFAKGMVVGAVLTTAVYRSRERKERNALGDTDLQGRSAESDGRARIGSALSSVPPSESPTSAPASSAQ